MNLLNLDTLIFLGFLSITLIIGLISSQGITTIRDYAVGNKKFTTATLVSTIIATWAGGEFFLAVIAEIHNYGLGFITVVLIGDFFVLYLVGSIFAPRMKEFLGKISIAEAMGDLFGNKVRIITAISGVIIASGTIAIQLQIAGTLFEYALGVNGYYGIIFPGIIISLYSSLGGVKSVTFTDVLQFLTFGVIIPFTAYILLSKAHGQEAVIDSIRSDPNFDPSIVFSFQNPHLYFLISILIWETIPSFNPAVFQRVAMARDTQQVKDSFRIAAFICVFLSAIICWIGVLTLSIYPNMQGDDIFKLILEDFAWLAGFKGLMLAGILAMVMSTIDSYINSTSVLLVHDLRSAFSAKSKKHYIHDELLATRICSMLVGIISILFAMKSGSFLNLFIWAGMFYMPVVTVPFIMAVFGFRSSEKTVLISMFMGFSVAMVWELFFKIHDIAGLIPGIFANLITLFVAHYYLKQPGGWVKKRKRAVSSKNIIKAIRHSIKNFSFTGVLNSSTPRSANFIALLGAFILVSFFSNITLLPNENREFYESVFTMIYPLTLIVSTLLIIYPLWSGNFKESNTVISYLWNIALFLILVCFSFMLLLLSNFSPMALVIFMANIIVISAVLRWRLALFYIIFGIISTFLLYKQYLLSYVIAVDTISPEFKIIYLILLVSSTLIVFLKPNQEYLEETKTTIHFLQSEVKNLDKTLLNMNHIAQDLKQQVTHFSQRNKDQEAEIERLGATAQKILNNVNHELRLPVSNVMNFSDMLHDCLKNTNDEHLKELSDEVYKNSTRLSSMILNMLDLAMLEAQNIKLQKSRMNLSELVEDRVKTCRAIYLQDKDIDFKLIIEPNIMAVIDANYIRQVIDNIIINAIKFTPKGMIQVSVSSVERAAKIVIKDQGIGIPKTELADIFTPFKMGSNTESKAEGRGVGLALCKAAIEAHDGQIRAESSNSSVNGGAKFTIILPK